jgi:hypothetical protein
LDHQVTKIPRAQSEMVTVSLCAAAFLNVLVVHLLVTF